MKAEQTHTEILNAARREFASTGYAATTVKEIAAQAGVSVHTVYDSVGSKADLVRRLNHLIDTEARVGDIAAAVPSETDPGVVACVAAAITRRILERCGDIVRLSLDGARFEPGLAPIAAEGGRRHRAGAELLAGRLAGRGALRSGLTEESAAVSIAALSDVRLALVLMDDHGLDLDALESWMASTTARTVLRDQH